MDVITPEYAVLAYHAGHDVGLFEDNETARVTLYCAECSTDLADFTPLQN